MRSRSETVIDRHNLTTQSLSCMLYNHRRSGCSSFIHCLLTHRM